MPVYPWSCLACGAANEADAARCRACDGPAQATLAQLQEHRERFENRGGVVGARAPSLRPARPFAASRVALAVLWAVTLGDVPRHLR